MNAFKAAKRTIFPLIVGALLLAGPALADDESGYLGVMLQDLSPAMAKALQLGDQGGVLVSDVVDDSPAEKAGLLDGDVIIAFAGKSLDDNAALTRAVRAAKPGDKVEVTVLRDGKKKTIEVEIGEREDDFVWNMAKGGDMQFFGGDDDVKVIMKGLPEGHFELQSLHGDRGWLGVKIDDVGAQLGEYFGVKDGEGVLVTEVTGDSPAAKAGLKAGDVIIRVGTTDVGDTDALHEALADTKAEDKVNVEFVRKGKKQAADVTLGEMPESDLPGVYFHGGNDVRMRAPRMIHRHMVPGGGHDVHISASPERRIEIIRDMGDAEKDLKEMRQELDQMREELKQMQHELQKK